MTALAKAMTTRQAAVIGEYMLIQHLTEPGSSQTAGRTTEHASDDRPGQAADDHARWAAGQTGSAHGGTDQGTDGATGLTCEVQGLDLVGSA